MSEGWRATVSKDTSCLLGHGVPSLTFNVHLSHEAILLAHRRYAAGLRGIDLAGSEPVPSGDTSH